MAFVLKLDLDMIIISTTTSKWKRSSLNRHQHKWTDRHTEKKAQKRMGKFGDTILDYLF